MLISSAFQTGFVATVVHTMNAAIAAIKRINRPQQPQQTGLILNYSSYVTCSQHENTIVGARFPVRLIADALTPDQLSAAPAGLALAQAGVPAVVEPRAQEVPGVVRSRRSGDQGRALPHHGRRLKGDRGVTRNESVTALTRNNTTQEPV